MNSCDHHACWSVVVANYNNCIPCVISYLESKREPLCSRRHSLLQLLESIKFNPVEHMHIFDVTLARHSISVFLHLYSDLNDITLQLILKDAIKIFHNEFGSEIVEIISSTLIQTITSNCKGSLLTLMLEVLNDIPEIISEFFRIDQFVDFLIQQLGYHKNNEILLKIFIVLLSTVEVCENLILFAGLSGKIVGFVLNSDSNQIIASSLELLCHASNYDDFLQWLTFEKTGPLFAGIKRIFLYRCDDFTQLCVKCLANIINFHCDIIEEFLNADTLEFVFDALTTAANESFISSAYDLILVLSQNQTFFTSCHVIHCFDPIAKSLNLCISSESAILPAKGFHLLKVLLLSNLTNVSNLQTLNEFDQVLQVLTDGLSSKHIHLLNNVVGAAYGLIKNLPQPIPDKDVLQLVKTFHDNPFNVISGMLNTQLSNADKQEVIDCLYQVFQCLEEVSRLNFMYEHTSIENELHTGAINKWIPLVQIYFDYVTSSDIFEIFLSYMTGLLRMRKQGNSSDLSRQLVTYFLIITMQKKTGDSVSEIEVEIDENFLFLGFQKFTDKYTQVPFSIIDDREELSAFIVLLALLTWHNMCYLSPDEILLVSENSLLEEIPIFALRMGFLLISESQKELLTPVIPNIMILRLTNEDKLYFEHSSVVSMILQNQNITSPHKTATLLQWISKAEIDSSDHYLKHIMGLILLNNDLVSVVMDSFVLCKDYSQTSKLVLIFAEAFDYSVDSSEGSQDSEFLESIQTILPDLAKKHLNWDIVNVVPSFVTTSVLELLQTTLNLTSNVLFRHRILRQVLILVVNVSEKENCDIILNDDVIINKSLEFINQVLLNNNCATDFSLVLFHGNFLVTLQNLIDTELSVELMCLISTLIQLQAQHNNKVDVILELNSKILLKKVTELTFNEKLQSSCILLWSSLFEQSLNSSICKFKPPFIQLSLFNPDDLTIGPLNRKMFLELWLHVLNATAKGYPGMRENANKCILAMLKHTHAVNSDLFSYFSSSPWLQFSFLLNRCENTQTETEAKIIEFLLNNN